MNLYYNYVVFFCSTMSFILRFELGFCESGSGRLKTMYEDRHENTQIPPRLRYLFKMTSSTNLKPGEDDDEIELPLDIDALPIGARNGIRRHNPKNRLSSIISTTKDKSEARRDSGDNVLLEVKRNSGSATPAPTPDPVPQMALQFYQHRLNATDLHRLMMSRPNFQRRPM